MPIPGAPLPYNGYVARCAIAYGARPEDGRYRFRDGSAIRVAEPWGKTLMYTVRPDTEAGWSHETTAGPQKDGTTRPQTGIDRYRWPEILELRGIPGITSGQQMSITRAAGIGDRTGEVRRTLQGWIRDQGRMKAVIRTLIDESGGPYLAENPGDTVRPVQLGRADAITIVISGRRMKDDRIEHIVLDTDVAVVTRDREMHEAAAVRAVTTEDCRASVAEIRSQLSQVFDLTVGDVDDDDRSPEERHGSQTDRSARAALEAPRNEMAEERSTRSRHYPNLVRATSSVRIQMGEGRVHGSGLAEARTLDEAVRTAEAAARDDAQEQLRQRLEERLGRTGPGREQE